MGKADAAVVSAVMGQVDEALRASSHRPVVIGICGAQGSGKSTLAAQVATACGAEGLACAILSIDDLYLTKAERRALAETIHPLLATRGVPGTHDVALGLSVLDALERGEAVALPRFDKARDERALPESWPAAPVPCDVLLFEGWCVGARPQAQVDLLHPVNLLESVEDAKGAWRAYANKALAGEYQRLFSRIDRLVLLAAPGFKVVARWRLEQEEQLAKACPQASGIMDAAAVARFVAHYERITAHILREMPARADLAVSLDEARRPVSILSRA